MTSSSRCKGNENHNAGRWVTLTLMIMSHDFLRCKKRELLENLPIEGKMRER